MTRADELRNLAREFAEQAVISSELSLALLNVLATITDEVPPECHDTPAVRKCREIILFAGEQGRNTMQAQSHLVARLYAVATDLARSEAQTN